MQRRQAIALEKSLPEQSQSERAPMPAVTEPGPARAAPLRVDRKSIGVMALMMLLSWAVVGYDIYDRHQFLPIHSDLTDFRKQWDDTKPLERVYGDVRPFVNETVVLDRRYFIDPTFDNVTFVYNGTGPVGMDNPKFIGHPVVNIRFGSKNKVVTQTMAISDTLAVAVGCRTVELLNLGPNAQPIGGPTP